MQVGPELIAPAVNGVRLTQRQARIMLLQQPLGLPGPELVALKKRGVEITRRVEIPLLAYCGDTAPGDFLSLDCVRDAKILLLECTFVEPDHLDRARAGYHIHISHLRELLPQLNNERILLTHLSRRSVFAEARKLLRRELGSEADERVTFLMDARYRRRRGPRRREPEGEVPARPE